MKIASKITTRHPGLERAVEIYASKSGLIHSQGSVERELAEGTLIIHHSHTDNRRTTGHLWNRFVFLLICLLLGTFRGVAASPPLPVQLEAQILRGIEATIETDFAAAESIFQTLVQEYPEQPWGYFYLAATYQAQMLDAEAYGRLPRFYALLDSCVDRAEKLRRENPRDVWALFFEGSAYLYRSFMDSKRGKLWGAYRNAVKGAGRLQEAIRIDSTFYDAYLGVGSFKYWKSRKAKFLTWLPFIADEREEGIAMVRTAVEKGRFVTLAARDQLAWILLDAKRYEEALKMALINHRAYPQSRFFLWTLVEIYYRSGQMDAAYQIYEQLLKQVRQLPNNNHYNEIVCLLRMAEIRFEQGDYETVQQLTRSIFRFKLSDEVKKRTRSKRQRALELQRKSERELSRLEPTTE
ncbi:MAG: tetratricopeptide repeat protein [Calditrichaeota bacterium]|nr:MAG: tetratricopeptide repeat protein [Calditrichota bacterium]